jgi:uncharacterized protein YkwD
VRQLASSQVGGGVTPDLRSYVCHEHQAGCTNDVKINRKLQLAAERHTTDLLNNRALDGDIGSDGSTVAQRARNAGYTPVPRSRST